MSNPLDIHLGTYVVTDDWPVRVNFGCFTRPKGSTVEVVQHCLELSKSLVRFGPRDIAWVSDSQLNLFAARQAQETKEKG